MVLSRERIVYSILTNSLGNQGRLDGFQWRFRVPANWLPDKFRSLQGELQSRIFSLLKRLIIDWIIWSQPNQDID